MYNSALNLTRLLGLAAIGAVIAGCGSGDSSGDPPPAGTARIDVTVSSDSGPVSGAAVSFQTTDASGANKKYETQTGANGNAILDMPLAEVRGVKQPAGTVVKEGYEPQTIICAGFDKDPAYCEADVKLIALAPNVSIPVNGDTVWHIGDSNYQGQVNSQLQKKAPDGPTLEFEISDWAAQVAKNGVTKATVVLDHKGWQTSLCPSNTIAIVGDAGTVSRAGGNSPDDGGWGGGQQEAAPFDFLVQGVGTLSAKVRISAGACLGPDLDDFEINRMRVYFCGTDYQGKHGSCIPAE